MDNKSSILKLIKSAECKSAEEIKLYAQACVELDVIKILDNQMVINMKSVIGITDFVIQGNDPEIVSFIKETCCKDNKKPFSILSGFKFKSVWRKVQSEWGKMAPYLKILMNGMYIPFNEEVLDCTLELLEAFNEDALLYEDIIEDIIAKCKDIPYTKVVEAVRRELGIN